MMAGVSTVEDTLVFEEAAGARMARPRWRVLEGRQKGPDLSCCFFGRNARNNYSVMAVYHDKEAACLDLPLPKLNPSTSGRDDSRSLAGR